MYQIDLTITTQVARKSTLPNLQSDCKINVEDQMKDMVRPEFYFALHSAPSLSDSIPNQESIFSKVFFQ